MIIINNLPLSLMLIGVPSLLSFAHPVICYQNQHHNQGRWHLSGRAGLGTPTTTTISPCTGQGCVTAMPPPEESTLSCDQANGTEIVSTKGSRWTLLCDIDFYGQDVYPLETADSFTSCLEKCEALNQRQENACAGFVFAPTRVSLGTDCYLKGSLRNAVYPATIHLIGATVVPTPVNTVPRSMEQSENGENSSRVPTVVRSTFLGTSVNRPTGQYVSHLPNSPIKLSADVLEPGMNIDLVTRYPLAGDTGTWTEGSRSSRLANLTLQPKMARDGGKGGMIDGSHVFIFCDTSTYGVEKTALGYLNGFVSSSVAVDQDLDGRNGNPLTLVDPVGQWQDDVGRLRGWAPMTTGEEAFNVALSGKGYRYAVWPESGPITLNQTHALLYASLVYVVVDMVEQANPTFTTLGNTLLLVSVDETYGPHADRVLRQLFTGDEVTWGSLGGFRSWTASGRDSLDGDVYLFGQVDNGILVGKVAAADVAERSLYRYWNGHVWTGEMPPRESSADAFLIDQPVMDFDLFYSPFHQTFIMVYLTPFADNTFYYRYLQGASIVPPYEDGGDPDYAEQILQHQWSQEQVLFQVPAPIRGYIYAGGVHAAYFGDDDITEGGIKMLCTWTEHTAVDPDVPESGYAHKAQVIELAW